MTPYSGLLFFYLLALLLLPAVVLGLLGRPLKIYGLIFSVLMLVIVFGEGGQLPALIAFYLWEAAIFLAYRRWRARLPLWAVVLFAALPLALVKVGEVWSPFAVFRLLGISYMTFRAVEALLNLHDGTVEALSFFQWSSFLLFFPSVSSGPIDRCRRFLSDLERKITPEEYIDLLRRGVWKLIGGAFSAITTSLINDVIMAFCPPSLICTAIPSSSFSILPGAAVWPLERGIFWASGYRITFASPFSAWI